MIRERVTIINKLGLHARAAAKLVATASNYACDVEIQRDNKKVNGKSIMGVMMLAASQGTDIELFVSGDEEAHAVKELVTLIANRFGEEE